jgi:hypothetical protein
VIGGPRRRQLPIKELWTNVSLRKARCSCKRRIAGIKEALLSREDESRKHRVTTAEFHEYSTRTARTTQKRERQAKLTLLERTDLIIPILHLTRGILILPYTYY